ncbi:hypothetical protein [Mycobacterium kyogaense]|uniref:hypothetical protein n=1 Tax=Mycobacterium kyogaense TaxID=2212479 RepID=UPI000DACAFDF|nr:hypothetical protein [Mycobacterium kyogaense]
MTQSWDDGRWGQTELYLPAKLRREETRARIEAHVKELLAETGEWPVVLGCPHGGRQVSPDTLLWLIEYRTGPEGQEPRWRSMPSQRHR